MDQNKILHDPRHLAVPLSASKTIFEYVLHSMQTVHLSCTYTNTVSKQIEIRFHKNHVT
jgi:hypothetical protein